MVKYKKTRKLKGGEPNEIWYKKMMEQNEEQTFNKRQQNIYKAIQELKKTQVNINEQKKKEIQLRQLEALALQDKKFRRQKLEEIERQKREKEREERERKIKELLTKNKQDRVLSSQKKQEIFISLFGKLAPGYIYNDANKIIGPNDTEMSKLTYLTMFNKYGNPLTSKPESIASFGKTYANSTARRSVAKTPARTPSRKSVVARTARGRSVATGISDARTPSRSYRRVNL